MLRRIWQSIVLRGPVIPRTDRDRAFVTVHTLLLHLRPVKLPAPTLRFTHTFGLGGSSLVLITILAATGILLMLAYQPVPGAAYDSTLAIENRVVFGPLVRGVHYWSANLLVIVLLLHAARVFLTGGYHGPRQFNWVIGVTLLAVVLANAFTGYLLPWDQLSYWAITISTGMLGYVPWLGTALQRVARGGTEIGADTLTLFYAVHTSIVPTLLVVLMAFHFWRVRKAGGVVVPPAAGAATGTPPPSAVSPGAGGRSETLVDAGGHDTLSGSPEAEAGPEKVLFLPHLLVREVALALAITALVLVLGAAFGAPLGAPANAGMSPNPAKAPWYFLGLQELLVHFHPVIAVVLIPLAGVVALALLPYVSADDEPVGAWFLSSRARRAALSAAIAAVVVTPGAIVAHDLVSRVRPGAANWLTGGVLPLAAVLGASYALVRALQVRLALTRNETIQTAVVLGSAAFAVLTAAGIWFRGPGMSLVWPWMR
jgi:quinol-cytochrome oxidoreductase complex cytochrome b subunit